MATLQEELKNLLADERVVNNAINYKAKKGEFVPEDVKKIKVLQINKAIRENPFVNLPTLIPEKFFISWTSYYLWAKHYGIPTLRPKALRQAAREAHFKSLRGTGMGWTEAQKRAQAWWRGKVKEGRMGKGGPILQTEKTGVVAMVKKAGVEIPKIDHGPSHMWTPKQEREILAKGEPLFQGGMKMIQIDELFGIPKGTFSRMRRDTGKFEKHRVYRAQKPAANANGQLADRMLNVIKGMNSLSDVERLQLENALLKGLLAERG